MTMTNAPQDFTPTEITTVLCARIADLAIGATLSLTAGRVVRVKRSEYVLHADNNSERARWGTCQEITQDTAHFLTTGVLPKANGGRW